MDNIIVTIARQYGSGGKTIGEMYAKEMGINCYSREILRMASDDSGINELLFHQADEKLKGSNLFGWAKKIYKGDLIPPESDDFASDRNLFNYQAKIIKQLAEQESCVIVGRAADFILKEYPNVVRVFVHAPMDYCIARALERSAITSEKEMERFIIKTDKHRGDFYKYYTGKVWHDARNYDLCLDSSKLGFEKCVEAIKQYIALRFDQ
jgi:cytidylate kinase